MKDIRRISHWLDWLPEHEKKHIVSARKALNATLSMITSVEDIKNRFSLKYIKDEGYWFFDIEMNKNIGYIHIWGVKANWVLSLQTYWINPVYQKYWLSSVMLWLFIEHYVPKLEKDRWCTLSWVEFWTQLLREHITASSLKYFSVADWVIQGAQLDEIYASSLQKLTEPHLEFNSATEHIHVWKYWML